MIIGWAKWGSISSSGPAGLGHWIGMGIHRRRATSASFVDLGISIWDLLDLNADD